MGFNKSLESIGSTIYAPTRERIIARERLNAYLNDPHPLKIKFLPTQQPVQVPR